MSIKYIYVVRKGNMITMQKFDDLENDKIMYIKIDNAKYPKVNGWISRNSQKYTIDEFIKWLENKYFVFIHMLSDSVNIFKNIMKLNIWISNDDHIYVNTQIKNKILVTFHRHFDTSQFINYKQIDNDIDLSIEHDLEQIYYLFFEHNIHNYGVITIKTDEISSSKIIAPYGCKITNIKNENELLELYIKK